MATSPNIKVADWLHDDFVDLQSDPEYLAEQLLIDIAIAIGNVMDEQSVNQKELAERLGISKSAVSQLLRGDKNISMERLVRVAHALNRRVEVPKLLPLTSPDVERVDTTVSVEIESPSLDTGRHLSQGRHSWGDAVEGPQSISVTVEGKPVDMEEDPRTFANA